MNTYKPMLNSPLIVSILLGRFSACVGSVVAPIYFALFVLSRTQPANRPELAEVVLPSLLPEVGLALGMVGIALAYLGRRPAPNVCILGLVLNAIPLALAVALRFLAVGS